MKDHEIPLRITLVDPPVGVVFALQRERSELAQVTRASAVPIAFDFAVRRRPATDGVRLVGPFVQGPPAARFVYVNAGTYAGDASSCWSRRAKVPLGGIDEAQLRQLEASRGAVLEARIAGTGRDGGPACGSVPLLEGGWSVVAAARSVVA